MDGLVRWLRTYLRYQPFGFLIASSSLAIIYICPVCSVQPLFKHSYIASVNCSSHFWGCAFNHSAAVCSPLLIIILFKSISIVRQIYIVFFRFAKYALPLSAWCWPKPRLARFHIAKGRSLQINLRLRPATTKKRRRITTSFS